MKKKSGHLSSFPGYVHPNPFQEKNTLQMGVGGRGVEVMGKERKKEKWAAMCATWLK